jgi:hypothetical protein
LNRCDRDTQIDQLLLAYREALGERTGASDKSAGKSSRLLESTDLWREGERMFVELERCLDLLAEHGPTQLNHLKACYGLPPYDLAVTHREVKRRGAVIVKGLQPNDRLRSQQLPDGWNRAGKPVTIDATVTVETWPAWVRQRKVSLARHFLAQTFLRGRKHDEIYIPVSFVQAAA